MHRDVYFVYFYGSETLEMTRTSERGWQARGACMATVEDNTGLENGVSGADC